MILKIVPFDEDKHREQFFEMNVEFVTWSHEQILEHHKVDMSEGTEGSALDYVNATFDDLLSLVPPKGFIYVLEDEQNLAGMVLVKTIAPGVGEVKRMFIRPKYRGGGLGHELMKFLVSKAIELDYKILRLETANFMPTALRIYRSAGFTERGPYPGGEIPEWYQPYCIFMEKDLSPDL